MCPRKVSLTYPQCVREEQVVLNFRRVFESVRRTFEGFLIHILDHWTYFVGYGLLLGLGCKQWPHFIGSGGMFLAVTYPILVVGALGTRPAQSADADSITWLEDKVSRLFRFPLVLSMHPALFCTNLIVRSCVGVAYQLWF
ncbi:hypothetical protein AHF37_05921 [Paragonimus kellicotti]|nr:hypothetical protein AHF37_05921 [Paragonimus kellicotti]